jgi:hypothetical protein
MNDNLGVGVRSAEDDPSDPAMESRSGVARARQPLYIGSQFKAVRRMPMTPIDLTPVERGALLALMAAGRPLKENSELRAIHGIALKENHRKKLQSLGLIDTVKKPHLMHSLSKKGWQWAREEIAAPAPKGTMGMGALYAVLGGLRRYIERQGCQLEDVFVKAETNGADRARQHVQEAAWSEADEALGQALQDIPTFTKAIEALQQAASKELNGLVKRTSGAAKLVLQSVKHAGRKRELSVATEAGTETAFDPVLHRSDDDPQPGDRVRVRKPPIVRGPANARVVVLPGEVEPV